MKTLTSFLLICFLVLTVLVLTPRLARAQNTIFVPVCTGNATADTAQFTNAKTAIGVTNLGTIRIPYKSNILQRCKLNTFATGANITLDDTDGTGIEVVSGQTLTAARIVSPNRKQMFFGTGTVVVTSGGIISAHWFAGADIGLQIAAASTAATGVPTEIQAYGGGTLGSITIIQEQHTLHLFPGTYTMNTSGGVAGGGTNTGVIQLKDNTQLIGEGDNTILVENSTPNCAGATCRYRMVYSWATSQSPINQLQSNNIQIRNLQFQGVVTNPHDGGGATAIFLGNCHGCKVTNNFFNRVSGYAIQFGGNPQSGFYAKDCVFAYNRVLNLQSQNVALITGENIEISHNSFTDPGVPPIAVTNATNATPVVITTATPNNVITGSKVWVAGVLGNTAANSNAGAGLAWYATRISSTQFSLTGTIDANGTVTPGNVAGSGPYTSGTGFMVNQGPALVVIDVEPNGSGVAGEEKLRNVSIQDNHFDLRNATTIVGGISYNPPDSGIPNEGAVISGNTILGRAVGVVVTGATNASPIVITADQNEFVTGDVVQISGVAGNTAANGTWAVTRINGDTFSLTNSVGNGAFSSSPSSVAVKWAGGQTLLALGIATSRYSKGAIVAENVIKRASQSAILAGGDGINVNNNTIVDSGTGGSPAISLSYLTNSKVSDNRATWFDDHEVFIGEADVNTNNIIQNNRLDLIEHLAGSTVTNSTYQGNIAVTGPTGTYGGIKESTNSNNNTYINNTTQPGNGGTLYGLTLVGSTSTYIKHNFTNKSGTTFGIQPKFCFTGLACVYAGAGSPEGAQTAIVGSVYTNLTNGVLYNKTSGSGNTGWTTSGGFSNPLTTTGDIIYASNTAAPSNPARLAIGTAGQCLTVAGGIPVWAACATPTAGGSNTQVQFNDSSAFGADAAFVWDNVNKRLGVGTASPSSSLHVSNNLSGTDGGVTISQYSAAPGPSVLFQSARGTSGLPTAVQADDPIGRMLGRGYGTTGFGVNSPAAIFFYAQQNFTDANHGTYTAFLNTPNGSLSRAEDMRVSSAGLDVVAHSAFGSGASIDQLTGLTGVGPQLINARETITAFDPATTKMQGILSYYILNPSNDQAANFEIYGTRGITEVLDGNNRTWSGEIFGAGGTAIYNGTVSMNAIHGGWFDAQVGNVGTSAIVHGVLGTARIYGSGGAVNGAWGGQFSFENNGTKTVNFPRGLTASIANNSTGTLGSASTIQAATPVNPLGTITTLIQLDVRDPTGTCTTCYGAWIRGATLFNLLEGNLGIGGIATPAGKVDIAGSLNFTALTAPSAVTAGTPSAGGSCTAGTHSYKVTFTTAGAGETTGSTASSIITCVNTTGQTVPLTAIPLGPIGTTSRKVYRTVTGNAGNYLLLATIANNTSTTFSDTVADGSLGAAAPGSNTTAVANFSTGGTNRAVITSTGLVGINQSSPIVSLHVSGKILSDPQGLNTSGVGTAPIHYYGNPNDTGQALHISARQNETLPNVADPTNFILGYFSADNTNGRGGTGAGGGSLWGQDVVMQMLSAGSGGVPVYGRTMEVETGTEIDTVDTPFGPLTGSLARANGIELVSINGHSFRPTSALGIWTSDLSGPVDGANWWKTGIYVSRVYNYGLWFNAIAGDAVDPFNTAMIFADSPTPYVIKGAARTFTNGVDFTASTITTCAFCSPSFNVSGSGVLNASTILAGHTAALGRLGQHLEATTGANYGGIALSTYSATAAEAPILDFSRSKSASIGTQTIVASGDTLGYAIFRGSDGTAFRDAASIRVTVDGTPGASDMPGAIAFATSLDGSANLLTRLTINNVGITSLYKGADVASAGTITSTGNTFILTGTTTISTISTTGITAGTVLTMVTTSAGLVFDELGNLDITNATSLTSTANGLVIAVWDGTKWRVR